MARCNNALAYRIGADARRASSITAGSASRCLVPAFTTAASRKFSSRRTSFPRRLRRSRATLSIALQYGAELETLRGAVTRAENGSPATLLGAALDTLANEKGTDVIDGEQSN
jgi:hypothetical protein